MPRRANEDKNEKGNLFTSDLDAALKLWFHRADAGGRMTAATLTADDARLDIGWVVGATFRVLRTRAVDLLLVALPFVWLPSLITGFAPDNRALQLLMNLPGLVFTGGASLITYQQLTGGLPVNASDATRAAVARFGTLWLVGIASGLMTLIGLVLLIVPGVIAALGFCAASSVVMARTRTRSRRSSAPGTSAAASAGDCSAWWGCWWSRCWCYCWASSSSAS